MKHPNWKNLGWAVAAVFGTLAIIAAIVFGGGSLIAYLFDTTPSTGSLIACVATLICMAVGYMYDGICRADGSK